MCGIAGYVGDENVEAARAAVGGMVAALAHRGPNAEGIESWPKAVLGHRRLSIFDLSDAGRQPMLSQDGGIAVVFNGAIYNFVELRSELRARGYEFRSQTDTEVLVHGYREWGFDRLVARLKGMFAIGLWDDHSQKLYLVRDRLGVKPLYYACRDGKLAFASTARSLRAGGFAGEIDEQAVVEFLEFGFVTDERSIYQGVFKVPAASIVEWSGGRIETRDYWQPPSIRADGAVTFDDAVVETERLFLEAVEKRLQADVPVGALLSGGVDSSLVCWAISKLGGDIKAFTIGTPGDPWDETADARETADKLGIDHVVIELSGEEEPDISEMIKAYGEPFACASALGMLRVSRAVRSVATVLLTGDGGDDVFLGYPEHLNFWRASRIARALPGVATSIWSSVRGVFPDSGPLRRVRSFLDYTTGGLGAAACVREGLPVYTKLGLLGERLADAKVSQRVLPWSIDSARDLLTEFLAYDRKMRFVCEYLTKVDGGTMFHALEARSPFLDQDLWSFASSLPYEVRLKGGQLKSVLREITRRRIDERVASGRKRGFGIPVHRWIAGRWCDKVRETFQDAYLGREGWIKIAPTLAQLERSIEQGSASTQLWYLFVLESWLRHEREHVNFAPQKAREIYHVVSVG